MLTTSRWVRWAGILGLSALAVTLVAAAQYFQGPKPVAGQSSSKGGAALPGVYCTGKVDVDPSLQKLFPQQQGAVDEVFVKDGDVVKAGAALLKINDEPFIVKEAQASNAVTIAEAKAAQARQALAQHEELVKGTEAQLEMAKQHVVAVEEKIHISEKHLATNPPEKAAIESELKIARAELAGRREAVRGKEAELRGVEKGRPTSVLKAAEENVALEKARLDEAKEARKRCTLTAPVDGTVLRVDAPRGTVFSAQSHDPAIIFAPHGEWFVRLDVDQEYAYRIAPKAAAVIYDESNVAHKWAGEVVRVGDAYLPPRPGISSQVVTMNQDTPKLEVIVKFRGLTPGDPRVRLGQKMTVKIESSDSATIARASDQ